MALMNEIKQRNQDFMKAFSSGDPTGCASFYAPDCYMMPHGRDAIRGRQGAETYFRQDMAEGVKCVTLTTDEVNGGGEWAFERGHYSLDGSHGTETGSYVMVWKKIDNKWYMYNDCFNVIKPAKG